MVDPGLGNRKSNPSISWTLAIYSADSFQIYHYSQQLFYFITCTSKVLFVRVCHFRLRRLMKTISIIKVAIKSIFTHLHYRKKRDKEARKIYSYYTVVWRSHSIKLIQTMFSQAPTPLVCSKYRAELNG